MTHTCPYTASQATPEDTDALVDELEDSKITQMLS
jgi:hypothetical protein